MILILQGLINVFQTRPAPENQMAPLFPHSNQTSPIQEPIQWGVT